MSAARAAFASQTPRVRVLFDSGGGNLGPGALQPTYETSASSWPPAGTVTSLFLGAGGTLTPTAAGSATNEAFTPPGDSTSNQLRRPQRLESQAQLELDHRPVS